MIDQEEISSHTLTGDNDMHTLISEEIEEYCARHSVRESSLLTELAKETYRSTDLPQMMVGQVEGDFLRLLVRILNAHRILEIGTFTGYSALAMAEGLPEDGKLITLDINSNSTEIAKRYWAQSPHGKKIELKLGPALQTIKTLEGPFDMVFIDADKENYVNYWEASLPKIRSGGILVADNVLWSGRVLHPQESSDKAIVAFNKFVASDSRVESVMLTVRDGMTVAWKR